MVIRDRGRQDDDSAPQLRQPKELQVARIQPMTTTELLEHALLDLCRIQPDERDYRIDTAKILLAYAIAKQRGQEPADVIAEMELAAQVLEKRH